MPMTPRVLAAAAAALGRRDDDVDTFFWGPAGPPAGSCETGCKNQLFELPFKKMPPTPSAVLFAGPTLTNFTN